MHGVLHIAARTGAPLLNEAVLSTSRDELIARTGSRYAPASPCEGLGLIEKAPAPCAFIGKPCDVAAARRAAAQRSSLGAKLGPTIAIFCAGTPTTRASRALLARMGVEDPESVVALRYRGHGWPGRMTATMRTSHGLVTRGLSYEEGWGEILTRDKQWRCHICPDHTGEFADLSVGDPWQHAPEPGEPGRSLIVVRTRRGRALLESALHGELLAARRVDPGAIEASQPNLLRGRGAVFGRVLALRMAGLPAPRFNGFATGRFWWSRLSTREKLATLLGTLRRSRTRGLDRIAQINPLPMPSACVPTRAAA